MTKQYVPVEQSINAAVITSISVTTTATLDDGSIVGVPNGTVEGDYLIISNDGSSKVDAKSDFESKYKEA